MAEIGGRIDREVPEPNVSAFKRKRVRLPDGTFGYRVVRPDWEATLTALRRGECNALAVVDIDRATRDPRILEDLIDAVELYGVYVVSMTGNIDLASDAGISAARTLVNQRNAESRNNSRRVSVGKRRAAAKGQKNGGPHRPYGWLKDRETLSKRESAHLRQALPRIEAGVSPLTLAREWNDRGIRTVTGAPWRAATIRDIFLNPRMCGKVVYRGDILLDDSGEPIRGKWEPILTDEEYETVVRSWGQRRQRGSSRLGGVGRGYRTYHLLSPFVRCGKCNARMVGSTVRSKRTGELRPVYRCPSKGQGGCGGVSRDARSIDAYIKALVFADQERVNPRKFEDLPAWDGEKDLRDMEKRIEESTRRYESGEYAAERYFPSLARMESKVAELRRDKRQHEARQDARKAIVADLEAEWEKPSFTMEQKQAAVGQSLIAVIIHPANRGVSFHPDQLTPIFRIE